MAVGSGKQTRHSESCEVNQAVVRLQTGVLTIVCALLGGVGLFVMTVWLLIKNGPQTGLHLQLLRYYFIGYSVTWLGSIVGFIYGALIGSIVGWTIGKIYNSVVSWRQH